MKRLFVFVFWFGAALVRADPFVNLGFAEVNTNTSQLIYDSLNRYHRGSGPVTDLLRGWQLSIGGMQLTNIFFNGGPGLIFGDGFNVFSSSVPLGLITDKAVLYINSEAVGATYSLVQHGDIPVGAASCRLDILSTSFGVSLAINDTPVPLDFLSSPLAAISGDISGFAGKNVEFKLTITDPGPQTPGGAGYLILNGVQFIVADVVFEHQDGFVGVWFMNKGPELISASFFNPKSVGDPRWHIVGPGDFNTDNRTDLLFQHEDGTLAVWYMDGTNLLSAALLNPSQPGEGWKVVGTGDMNYDGKKDILFQHTDGTLAVWFMNGINLGQGALLNPNRPGDSGWRVAGTASLTRVGNTDLIFQHSDGTLAAWYMDGINLVRGALLNPSAPGEAGWRVATTLDLNGDGKTDLLFQHDDGTVAVWLMDGIDLISGEFLNPANPGSGWRIAGPR